MGKIKTCLAALSFAAALPLLAYAEDADYEKGVAYLRAGRAVEALRLLEPLAAKDPADPYIQYHLGLAYYREGGLDKAAAAFGRVRELAGPRAGEDFSLGTAFSNLGIARYRKKDYDKAAESLGRALALDPADGDSRYYLGLVRIEQGDYKAALLELGRAASLKAGDDKATAAVQNAVGMAWYRQEDLKRAIHEFGKTLAIDTDNIEALYYMGLLNYKDSGYAAARPYFERVAARGAPDEKTRGALFTAFFNMGVDFQNRDKAEAASEMFGKAAALNPVDPDAHYYRGYNLMSLERYEEAVLEFREALALKPGMSRAKAQLEVAGRFASEGVAKAARESMDRGEIYAALALYEKAVSLDPSNSDAAKGLRSASEAVDRDRRERLTEIRARIAWGEYREATDAARELLKLDPSCQEAAALEGEAVGMIASIAGDYIHWAGVAEEREAFGEAAGYYQGALNADPDSREAADGLRRARARIDEERAKAGRALAEGQYLSARKSYEKLLKYVPEDEDARKGLDEVDEKIAAETERLLARAREALEAGDITKAASLVGKALDLSPQDKDALALRKSVSARAAEVAGNAQEAAPGSEEEVRRLYLLGVERYTKGELEDAVAAWKQVLKLDPGNEKAVGSINKAEEKLRQAR